MVRRLQPFRAKGVVIGTCAPNDERGDATFSALLDPPLPALIVDRGHRVRAANAALRDRVPARRAARAPLLRAAPRRRRRGPSARSRCPLERCLGTGTPSRPCTLTSRAGAAPREILLRPLVGTAAACVACLGRSTPPGRPASASGGARSAPGPPSARWGDRLPAAARGGRRSCSSARRGRESLGGEGDPPGERAGRPVRRAQLPRARRESLRELLVTSRPGARSTSATWTIWTAARRSVLWVGGPAAAEGPADHRRCANGSLRRSSLRAASAPTSATPAAHCLRLPPLRERPAELRRVALALLRAAEGPGRELSAEALDRLERHSFPGNFDELEQALQHASLMARGPTVQAADLPAGVGSMATAGAGSGPRGRTRRGSTAR